MSLYPIKLLNDPDCQYDTLLGPVTKLALAAASAKWSDWLGCDDSPMMVAAALAVVASEMVKTDDLTDTAEDRIRLAERHHQADQLLAIVDELNSTFT